MTLNGKAGEFLALHYSERPLLQPNAFDLGSARLLASLGFKAIATTSSGFATTLGRTDGRVTRDEAVAHAAALAAAVEIPVSADTENGFAPDPAGVATLVRLIGAAGVAGCSVEDFTKRTDDPIYERGLAAERVAAAAEAAHGGNHHVVLTARAENFIHDRRDLADTIARLQAYQEAGADVLFAPGVVDPSDLRSLLASVDKPVNVLAMPGCPAVAELAAMGVARVSVGGAFAFAAYGALVEAARELQDAGTFGYWEKVGPARAVIRDALSA